MKASDLEKLKQNAIKFNDTQSRIFDDKGGRALYNAFRFFEENNILFENLISELQEDFSEEKLISVNSKDESELKQLAVNTLEDENNEYRAVFAVDKLNEGWDVLNLFDIVRLYDTRDAKDGKPGKTTMSEAQLIGRGARYCPFRTSFEQSLYTRKYDDDLDNELRICEELYYHSAYNPRYIQELNIALEEIGIKPKEIRERAVKLKKEFKETSFYKSGFIFLNEQQKYNREDIFSLKSSLIEQTHKVSLKTGFTKASVFFNTQDNTGIERKQKDYKLLEFGEPVIRKALNKLEFYQFNNLKKYLPNLTSIKEFIESHNYLGKIKLEISGLADQINNLSQRDKLEAALIVLENISSVIASDKIEFKGSTEFKPFLLKDKIKDKTLNFAISDSNDKEFGKSMCNPNETSIYLDLSKKDWFVFEDSFGTSEEKHLIKYIDKVYDKLKSNYDEVYLVRSERHFKIYNFDDGRPLEPDFVLFLVRKEPTESLHYQIFIEPKGGHLLKTDEWKENFLKRLKEEQYIEQLWKGRNYTVWGMPFYNETLTKQAFEKKFNEFNTLKEPVR